MPKTHPLDDKDILTPQDADGDYGVLPELDLSDSIFESFGLEPTPDEDPFQFFSIEEDKPATEAVEAEIVEVQPELEPVGVLPDPFAEDEEQGSKDERAWFVIHCYSGYEQKVRYNLEQRIESMGMQEFIFQVVVPTVEEIEIRDGKRRTVERCLYPGYIMVQMTLTDDSWYVVRNTPGVTGFVGMGNTPTALRPEAVQNILRRMEAAAPQVRATFKLGQKVRIIEGPFADFIGMVDDIDEERTKVRVLVSFFGRETPVELDFLQVEKA
ncbi:MAG: transcription termination/antitermination factor NusG [Anaerolineae bacterium]|nr:transcription termination/antitermination factor NusG [Anaerolineae bacterium]